MTRAIATTGPVKADAAAPESGIQAMLKSAGVAARTSQTIGIEWLYFARASLSQSTEAARQLAKADSLGAALEIHADYAAGACERLAAQAATFRDLYAALAADMVKPFQGHPFGRMASRKAE